MLRAVLVIATLSALATGAQADRREADRAEAEAETLALAKDFLGAAAKFRAAYAADPRPDLICNVGVAYHKAQELPRAQLYLGRCLERGSVLRGGFMTVVRDTLARLEAALKAGNYTPVDVGVDPRFATVAIDAFAADETFDGGRTVWLPFGAYHVTVRAEGYRAQTVEVAAKDHAIVALHVALIREPVVAAPDQPPAAPPITTLDPVAPFAPAPAPRGPSLVLPVSATVATVGLAVIAGYARSQAQDHADRAGAPLPRAVYDAEADSIKRWNTIFGVDLALTGAAALASGYLWVRFARSPARSITPRVEASGQGAALLLDGQF
ncbi:MAG: hypothetical protein ABIY55_17430 [Kofleriaceae bacterium]